MNIDEIREYYKDLPDGKLQEIAKRGSQDLSEETRVIVKEELNRRGIAEPSQQINLLPMEDNHKLSLLAMPILWWVAGIFRYFGPPIIAFIVVIAWIVWWLRLLNDDIEQANTAIKNDGKGPRHNKILALIMAFFCVPIVYVWWMFTRTKYYNSGKMIPIVGTILVCLPFIAIVIAIVVHTLLTSGR